jgi:adenylate kinase
MSSDSSSQLEHLKSLVAQLQTKIERLESQASSTASDAKAKVGQAVEGAKETVKEAVGGAKEALTPAQHLRLVLMGPPGAGMSLLDLARPSRDCRMSLKLENFSLRFADIESVQ